MSDNNNEPLGMSDDVFGQLNMNTAFADEQENTGEPETEGAVAEGTPAGGGEGEGAEVEEGAEPTQEEGALTTGEEEEDESSEEPDGEEEEGTPEESGDPDPESDEEDDTPDENEEEQPDSEEVKAAKSFFDKVTAPFKANGQQMQIKDADDVVRLMQMGANYNKKMAGLKPALKVVKMLERSQLMDEDKLSFLIDLNNKDPQAIAKFLQDSDIDPMDLDLDEGKNYKPSKKHVVNDQQMALDEVIEDLKDSETYSKTLDVVSNKWDGKSRNIVATTPELMRVIDGHMQNGVYEAISTEVEKERTLGRLNGLSDIEAYKAIGDKLQASGGFNHLNGKSKTPTTQEAPTATKPAAPTKDAEAEARRAKRRAASPSKPSPTPAKKQSFSPLALSDEAFLRDADDSLLR